MPHPTTEQIEQARQASLADFFTQNGFETELSRNELHVKGYGGFETNEWYCFSQAEKHGGWEIIPRLIDREAWQMWELLRRQYAAQNPRPKTFVEIAVWEKTRSLVVEHEVMEQVILQCRE